ncbi:hypothetical protein H0H81_009104 [Sphagnurus paluster]|uniref:PNK3P-domain-containing protein n=1 Tax=Sphagnurus paluster TaxID=117069 RepID=A0A9P7FTS3_9AGAR|nr:hypothetical protein H0H81_009104 [Sphagnurus paluster]
MSSSRGSKRKVHEMSAHTESPQKINKIHPFFAKKVEQSSSESTGSFKWLETLGRTCLHGVNLSPKAFGKVAAFDLDGTLVRGPEFGHGNVKSVATPTAPHWGWWRPNVPEKLKEAVDSGYTVVIISNQALKPAALKTWKLKISSIAAALPNIPFRLFAATAKDGYRKPMLGMWSELESILAKEGVTINKTESFFVGDAAGRQYSNNKSDFSSTDRKWALNVGISFFTPEELVLFVGYPCLGKTSFYLRHFEPAGYAHVNQDTLKTRNNCVKEVQKVLKQGKNNTNRNVATRKYYVDIARELNVPTRLTSEAAIISLDANKLPDNFEEPELEEGFAEINQVNWVFRGTEVEKSYWSMWLQIDGK